jgi:colanic acid/amylovoran biosynthesis glycosyltransferase
MTRIAYLVGTYPGVSQSFIQREVLGLREAGIDVRTFTVHRLPPAELLTESDRREDAQTYAIQPPRPVHVLRAHLRALTQAPSRYLATLVRALRLPPRGARAALLHFFYFAEGILLWDRCRRLGIRHVHVHFANAASAIALLGARFAPEGMTWSFTMHGPTEFDDVTAYALADKVREAAWVACIGDFARSQLMKLVEPTCWDRIEIVHCGLDTDRFRPVERRPSPGPARVLSIGRLVPDKGQALLVDAVAALVRRGLDVELRVAGDGPDREALARRVRETGLDDRVTLLGAVSQDEVPRLYAWADVFCLPSFAEGKPVVIMEALAMGLPVVSTRVMGIPELVEDGVSGRLVAPGRSDELADALGELLVEPALRARMGSAGREHIVRGYDVRAIVPPLAARFRQLTAS